MTRRHYLQHTLTGAAAFGASCIVNGQEASPAPPRKSAERDRGPQLDPALVKEFVVAGHANLARVKQMLAAQPALINASYDWGSGDWEAALGGASHIGQRPMALLLLESGARIDAFCAAMLGEVEIVTGILRLSPHAANVRGPHGYSLLYHAGYSGKVAMAEAIGSQLRERARDCNHALQTASLAGHADFVEWLLKNGVDNPNTKNFQGKTPLDVARERGHEPVVKLLRAHGGLTSL